MPAPSISVVTAALEDLGAAMAAPTPPSWEEWENSKAALLDAALPMISAAVRKVVAETGVTLVTELTREQQDSTYVEVWLHIPGKNREHAGDIRISDHAPKYDCIFSIDPSVLKYRFEFADLVGALREAVLFAKGGVE